MWTLVIVGREATKILAKHLGALFATQRHLGARRNERFPAIVFGMTQDTVVPLLPRPDHELCVQHVFTHRWDDSPPSHYCGG